MLNIIKKYKYTYLFITILTTIGFISGIIYYQVQPQETKTETKELLNIKEELNIRHNNILKSLKNSSIIIINTISIIFIIKNVINIFYKPFEVGFIFSLLNTYNIKFSIIYILIYNIPSIIISVILTRISLTIIINIIKYIITKNRKIKKEILTQLKKYTIITLIELTYQISIYIISPKINAYLMTFI